MNTTVDKKKPLTINNLISLWEEYQQWRIRSLNRGAFPLEFNHFMKWIMERR